MGTVMTKEEAWKLANDWVAAWNAHDLVRIMTHYEDTVELTSPAVARLLGLADGKVVGKDKVRAYFQRGLEAFPELQFRLEDVLWGFISLISEEHTRRSSWSCRRAGKWRGWWQTTAREADPSLRSR
jgi:hypothetical protein